MRRGDPVAWQPFIAASLLLAIVAGFGLGGLLMAVAARHAAGGRWWEAAAQAHGHIQVFGWTGLMVLGVGAFLLPGMTGRRRLSWGLLWATGACANVAAVLRVAPVAVPGLLPGASAATAMAASGLIGLVALALFGINVVIGRAPAPATERRGA